MVDLKRRFFLFGVTAAAVVVTTKKSFFIMEPPKLIVEPPKLITAPRPLFDLPLQQMLDLMRKLDEQALDITAIPRWLIINQDDFDRLARTASRDTTGRHWRSQWPSTAHRTNGLLTT
jgi:hypothetical protein